MSTLDAQRRGRWCPAFRPGHSDPGWQICVAEIMNHHDRVTLQRPGCVGSPLDLQGRSRPRYRTLSRCSLSPRLSTASNSYALSPPPACRASTSPTLKTYGRSQHGSYWSKRIRHSYSSIDKHWSAITRVSRTKAGRACTYV